VRHLATRSIRVILTIVSLGVIACVTSVLRLSSSKRRIQIVVMDPRYFGHQCLEPEVFRSDREQAVARGSKDFWFCCLGKRRMASNKHLWDLTKSKLSTLPSWLVTDVKYWQRRFAFSSIQLLDASIYRLNFLTKKASEMPSADGCAARRQVILSHLRDPDRPYVVFTIREPGVWYDPVDPRNRAIQTFLPSMEKLAQLGYNVVRLTSQTKDPLRAGNPHILDWQVLLNGQEGDELAVISGATFVVSTTTGGDCLALAYRRPVLYIDSARIYLVFLGTELATFQVPQILDVSSGERLRLGEILRRGLGWVGDARQFVAAGAQIINSSAEQIERYVVEYEALIRSEPKESLSDSQNLWREELLAQHRHEIGERHGEIRANMLPSSIEQFASISN